MLFGVVTLVLFSTECLEYLAVVSRDFSALHFECGECPGYEVDICREFHRGQTSEAFFVLFSGILVNIKWKHGQECIK